MERQLSYVKGFKYNIRELTVEMSVVPFIYNGNKYDLILYLGYYNMALVKFKLDYLGESVSIYVPFYQSSGQNSSKIGAGTWFPFNCCSQNKENTRTEHYFRSEYGNTYIFKMGHYFFEPFSGRCEDLPRGLGLREETIVAPESTCGRQRNFMIQNTSEIPDNLLNPDIDTGIGIHTIFMRFGNLLYLTASYFLFGNGKGWDPNNFKENTPERAFAAVLNRISLNANFGGVKWKDIARSLPKSYFNTQNYLILDTGKQVNFILNINNVSMPHYQEVSRSQNGVDAKFTTCMKLLQLVGELYLETGSQELWNRFNVIYNRAKLITSIPITNLDNLFVSRDFNTWILQESFSDNNNFVRLYRFS